MEWSLAEVDVALVRIVDARWIPGVLHGEWWTPVTGTDEVRVTGLGFPHFQHDDTEQLVARLRPLSGLIRERLELVIDDPPAAASGSSSPWAGISGAAVFANDMLVGVVQTDAAETDHHRLRAVPASLFAEDADFARIVADDGGPAALRRSLLQRQQIDDLFELGLTDAGHLAAVREVDPYELRITETPYGRRGYRRDPYVARDSDTDLRASLERRNFVVLIGPSKAGKSRSAFEAALAVLPDAVLIVPRPGCRALQQLARGEILDTVCPDRRVVVWLDDLERFLVPSEGFDTGHVAQLARRDPRVVILATLRTDQYAQLVHPGTEEIDKTVRQILAVAEQVRLELTLSDTERERAAAIYPDEDFSGGVGIGERLVAGPSLRDKLQGARGGDAVRWCLVLAAVDWRRIGMQRGIPEPDLREATAAYLADMAPSVDMTDVRYQDARAWALKPIAGELGRVSLLTRDRHTDPPVFDAFDYVIASVDGQDPELETPVNEHAWEVGMQRTKAPETSAVAYAAYARGVPTVAEGLWRSLAEDGDAEAANRLGVLLARQGRTRDAGRWYRQAAAAGYAGAMNNLGVLFDNRGRRKDAERWYRQAAEAGITEAMANLAELLDGPEELEEAEQFYRQAAMAGHRNALGNLTALLGNQGRLGELEREYRRLAEAGDTLAMSNLGMVFARQGRAEDAELWYRRAAGAGRTDAMFNIGVMREVQGRTDEAEHWYRQAANRGHTDAMAKLGELLATHGSNAEAERWLRQASNLGSPDAMAVLARLLETRGQLEEAERWYRPAAQAGRLDAIARLGRLLAARGSNEAEHWLRQASNYGDPEAKSILARLLEQR